MRTQAEEGLVQLLVSLLGCGVLEFLVVVWIEKLFALGWFLRVVLLYFDVTLMLEQYMVYGLILGFIDFVRSKKRAQFFQAFM